jgi:hypothetical protein
MLRKVAGTQKVGRVRMQSALSFAVPGGVLVCPSISQFSQQGS